MVSIAIENVLLLNCNLKHYSHEAAFTNNALQQQQQQQLTKYN